jgi:hypothetical protein
MFVVPAGAASVEFTRSLQRGAGGKSNWAAAPAVGFPSYSFSVSRTGGMNVGVPLSGIPVGMSLLDASQATGSVSIQKANTVGADVVPLSDDLEQWAERNAAYLLPYARDLDATTTRAMGRGRRKVPHRAYLRMVSRIFVTGAVDIAVADARSGAAGIDAGRPRPVDLLTPSAPGSPQDVDPGRVENQRAAVAALNAQLAESQVPTRASGSNAGATPAEADERTKAKLEERERLRKERREELDKADKALEESRTKAAPDREALDKARQTLREKRDELGKLSRDPNATPDKLAEAEKAVEDARADVEAKGATDALKSLARARGVADVAKLALDEVASVVPGGSLRVTSASSRLVTMRQEFEMPLVIGYHAFDREILFSRDQGLHLGPPVATQRQILDPAPPVVTLSSNNSPRAVQLRQAVRAWHNNEAEKIRQMNATRLKLYPNSRASGFGAWLQTVPEGQVEMLMRAADVPVPPAS